MAAKIRSDGTSPRSAAGEIHPALPKLRDQLQSGGRHGAPLHRETQRHQSRETLERIRQASVLATITEWINRLIRKVGIEEGDFRDRKKNCEGSREREREPSEFQAWKVNKSPGFMVSRFHLLCVNESNIPILGELTHGTIQRHLINL